VVCQVPNFTYPDGPASLRKKLPEIARMGMEQLKNKLDILKRHCETVGRDYAEIGKTTLASVHLAPGKMSAADVVKQCRELAAGVQHTIFNMPNVYEITPLEIFGRGIIPAAGF
jgi:hypothetical protein